MIHNARPNLMPNVAKLILYIFTKSGQILAKPFLCVDNCTFIFMLFLRGFQLPCVLLDWGWRECGGLYLGGPLLCQSLQARQPGGHLWCQPPGTEWGHCTKAWHRHLPQEAGGIWVGLDWYWIDTPPPPCQILIYRGFPKSIYESIERLNIQILSSSWREVWSSTNMPNIIK